VLREHLKPLRNSVNFIDGSEDTVLRYQFLEFLVRVGHRLYGSGEEQKLPFTYALNRLMADHILLRCNPKPWQRWREEHVWTSEVDNIFRANASVGLARLWNHVRPKQVFRLKDAIYWFSHKFELFKPAQVLFCYGMSAPSVKDQLRHLTNGEPFMEIEEFYEFLCRLAEAKF
jgi:hypothetical protein